MFILPVVLHHDYKVYDVYVVKYLRHATHPHRIEKSIVILNYKMYI